MSHTLQIDLLKDSALRGDLEGVRALLTDHTKLNQAIGTAIVYGPHVKFGRELRGLKAHLIQAATTRHTVANKLGVKPTEYLTHLANAVEIHATADGVDIVIGNNETGAGILARVLGDVVIVPDRRKWLCIPVTAKTHNTTPLNWPGQLAFVPSKRDKNTAFLIWRKNVSAAGVERSLDAALEPVDGGRKRSAGRSQRSAKAKKAARAKRVNDANGAKLDIAFVLKKQVTLPEDKGLLPTEKEFQDLASAGVRGAIDEALSKGGPLA